MLRVYAIVGKRLSRRVLGRTHCRGIRLVTAGRISAVVADGEEKVLLSASALRAHDATIKRIARAAPAVLPVRFGTVVRSDRALVELLERWSKELLAALVLVHRREQMTLRVFAGAGQTGRAGRAGTNEPDTRIPSDGRPGTGYLKRRAREHAAPEAPELEPLRAAFAPLVAAERITRHAHGPLLLTAYHLIPRGRAAAYRSLLRRHAPELDNRAVPSGPWPPYAFVPELGR